MRLNVKAPAEQKEAASVKGDAILQAIASRTPAQIDAYIDANVTDLASARRVLKALAKAVNLLVKKGL